MKNKNTLSSKEIIKNRCVILSPHNDDAAFSLGGTILSGFFKNITLVTIFSISRENVSDDNADINYITKIRKKEDVDFFKKIKRRITKLYLDRLDAPLRLNIESNQVFRNISKKDNIEIKYLNKFLKQFIKKNDVLLIPLGLGGHVDHLIVQKSIIPMTQHGNAIAFYEDLPYAARLSLLEIKRTIKKIEKIYSIQLVPYIITPKLNLNNKINAIKIYKSQINNNTILNINKHSNRIINGNLAERIWCNDGALKIIRSDVL